MSKIYLAVTAGSVHYKNALDGILELKRMWGAKVYLADTSASNGFKAHDSASATSVLNKRNQ